MATHTNQITGSNVRLGTEMPAGGHVLTDLLKSTPHPLLPWYATAEQVQAAVAKRGHDTIALLHQQRESRIALADPIKGDPFRYGFQLDHWHHADLILGRIPRTPENWDRPLPDLEALVGRVPMPDRLRAVPPPTLLALLGGNRSGKSQDCARIVVEDAVKLPGTTIVCFSETFEASRLTQQALIWDYLPKELKALNGKKDRRGVHYISYDLKGGFGLNQVVLPNRSKIIFRTYDQDTKDVEGWETGNRNHRACAFWLDEDAPLKVMETAQRRADYYGAFVLWSFTPVNGITPAVREVVNDACQTLVSLPSELLKERVNVPGLPVGHMPYIQTSARPGAVVMYFFSQFNPFGTGQGTFYAGVKRRCEGKASSIVMRLAYGYCVEMGHRAFPKFGAWNIIPQSRLPARGTNYLFIDPSGKKPWSLLWVRVAPGSPSKFYIYRDWPDATRFGEWAVPTERRTTDDSKKGWDGDPGPAQTSLGFGPDQYRDLILREESVHVSAEALAKELDTYRRQLIERGLKAGESTVPERIAERFIDPRAGRSPQTTEAGSSCIVDMLATRKPGKAPMIVLPATVRKGNYGEEHEGLNLVNDLLHWETDEPLVPILNEPRLYVADNCRQVIWALQNYTGRGGEDGACKDFVDLVRYVAFVGPTYRSEQPAEPAMTRGY